MTTPGAEKQGAAAIAPYRDVSAGHRPDHATGPPAAAGWTIMTVGAISNGLRRQCPGLRPVAAADRQLSEPRARDVASGGARHWLRTRLSPAGVGSGQIDAATDRGTHARTLCPRADRDVGARNRVVRSLQRRNR